MRITKTIQYDFYDNDEIISIIIKKDEDKVIIVQEQDGVKYKIDIPCKIWERIINQSSSHLELKQSDNKQALNVITKAWNYYWTKTAQEKTDINSFFDVIRYVLD